MQPLHRRGFLGVLATGAAALGISSLTSPASLSAKPKVIPGPSDDAGFETWLNKIKGKHRQVFDAPDANGGFPFAWSRIFYMTNNAVGTPDNEITVVVILRHDAIPLSMNHPLWEKYKFGEFFKITDKATNAPAVRNPFYQPKPNELPLPGMSIEDLIKTGVMFGACDMALTFYSGMMAKSMNADAAEIKKDWVSGILPGIQIVPSGVLAVNRTQEHGCTYCFAG
jgi:intracellular sulfur oxidation DsrE/DsrF family protein